MQNCLPKSCRHCRRRFQPTSRNCKWCPKCRPAETKAHSRERYQKWYEANGADLCARRKAARASQS